MVGKYRRRISRKQMNPTDKFKKIFYGASDNLLIQFVRYFFVGGFAFIVDFGLLYILTEYAGLHYLLSATLSFIAGLVVNYIISCIWVFNNSKFRNRIVEFLFFAAIGVVGLGFNDLLIWLFRLYRHTLHVLQNCRCRYGLLVELLRSQILGI